MNWKLVIKDAKNQPAKGVYSEWKEQIAKECYYQCVYCSINEVNWGGIDHYHIDHFRPKSRDEFKHLENDIMNLFYSCPVCNRFKSDDWKNEPDLNVISYMDPSITDYSTIFTIDNTTFKVNGLYTASKYMTQRLFLNRPQLVYERRENNLKIKEKQIFQEVQELLTQVTDKELTNRAIAVLSAVHTHLHNRNNVRPYKLEEIRKP